MNKVNKKLTVFRAVRLPVLLDEWIAKEVKKSLKARRKDSLSAVIIRALEAYRSNGRAS